LVSGGGESFVLEAGLNWRVLAVTMAIALATGALFGLAPALQSTGVDLSAALKQTRAGEQRRRVWGRLRISLSQSLVVAQIAVSLLLLVAAGLFVRTLSKLNSIDAGFNRDRMLLFTVHASQAGYRGDALAHFFQGLYARLAAIPGARSVTASHIAMLSNTMSSGGISVAGYGGKDPEAAFLFIAPEFFRTFEIPLLLGRPIEERDVATASKVAVVNEVFVKKYFGGQNPIGRRFQVSRAPNPIEVQVVGVSKNARYSSLKEELPEVAYLPYTYDGRSMGSLTFELRTAGDPMALAGAVREVVRQTDSRIPLTDLTTQDAVIDHTIGQERTFAFLCTAFALLAVAIACVGLYGSMAYNVARRTNEIGLRMALGAERRRLIWMVLREVFVMAAVGLAIGLPVALATTKFVKSFLFEMKPNDPWAIAGAAVALVLAAVAAGYGPAWRASRIDPWNALRHE
jgi:predicted permease